MSMTLHQVWSEINTHYMRMFEADANEDYDLLINSIRSLTNIIETNWKLLTSPKIPKQTRDLLQELVDEIGIDWEEHDSWFHRRPTSGKDLTVLLLLHLTHWIPDIYDGKKDGVPESLVNEYNSIDDAITRVYQMFEEKYLESYCLE